MLSTSPLLLLAALAVPQQPREPVELGASASKTALAQDGDLSVVVWQDARSGLHASTSDARGLEWSPAVEIDAAWPGTRGFWHQGVAVSDGSIYVVWSDTRDGKSNLQLSRSDDAGASWSAPTRVPDGALPGAEEVIHYQVEASGDNVYVAMRRSRAGLQFTDDIWFASSNDRGQTWNASLQANTATAGCFALAMAAEGDNAFVTWSDGRHASLNHATDLFLRMTHNAGASWMMNMGDEKINESPAGTGTVAWEGLDLQGGMTGLVAAWLERDLPAVGDPAQLHVRYSPDGGHMWPIPESTLGVHGGAVKEHALGFDGYTLVVAWVEESAGRDEVFAARSIDFGLNWSIEQISTTGGSAPRVAGAGDQWLVLYSPPGETQLLARSSRDGGASWLPAVDLLATNAGTASDADLHFDARYGNFLASWIDRPATAADRAVAGGVRPQTLTAHSPSFAPGDPLHFEASHFPISDDGANFLVFVSRGTGGFALPWQDGRLTGLASNPYLPAYLPVLSGTLDSGGFGATIPTVVPSTPGVTWYATALSYLVSSTTGRVYPLTLSDRIAIPVQ
ncbi:MAG: hypothetical protein CMJ94_00835 [Planctomycetes bacterium]|nr:hypothetical protein [Planctomycetota bacterium]